MAITRNEVHDASSKVVQPASTTEALNQTDCERSSCQAQEFETDILEAQRHASSTWLAD